MPHTRDLQQLVEEVSLTFFHKPFLHQAVYNPRLRTTGGRYMLGDHSIQINPLVMEMYGENELIGVIKHELCHYHLHLEGKGYQHRDQDFKALLKQTNAPRYCRPLGPRNQSQQKMHIYVCQTCRFTYQRKRCVNTEKYRCGKCAGKILKIEKKMK